MPPPLRLPQTLLLGPNDQLDELLKLEPPILKPPPRYASANGANDSVATIIIAAIMQVRKRVCIDFII